MTFTAKDRVFGEMVTFVAATAATGATALSTWKTFDFKFNAKKRACRAASSPVLQQGVFRDSVSGSAKGYVGEGESLPELPKVGDVLKTISAQTVTEGADLIGDISGYGDIVVTGTNYSQSEDAGDWGFDYESTGFTTTP